MSFTGYSILWAFMNAYRAMTPLRSTPWLFLGFPAPCGLRPVLSSGGHSQWQALPPIALQDCRSEGLPWPLRPSSRYSPWESTVASQSLAGSAPARRPSSRLRPSAPRCICVVLSSFPFRSITSCYRVHQTQDRPILFVEWDGTLVSRVEGYVDGPAFATAITKTTEDGPKVKTYLAEFKSGVYRNSQELVSMLLEMDR